MASYPSVRVYYLWLPMDTISQFPSSSAIFFAAHKLLPVPEKTKMMFFLIPLPIHFMAWYRMRIEREHRLKIKSYKRNVHSTYKSYYTESSFRCQYLLFEVK